MSEIEYQILDIYEGNNLKEGVLQNIPAYLTVSFEKKVNYTFVTKSPKGDIVGNISGIARSGFNHHWRIPILEQPGEWKIEINLQVAESGETIQEAILFYIPSQLFDYQSIDEYSREEDYLSELSMPTQEEIQYVDVTSKLVELDAHWLQIDPELQIYRYIYHDVESKLKDERFIPILLVHGFHSNYSTWNWMVRYLWADGFRNIFAMALYDDRLGVEKNTQHLEKVIDEILDLTNSESLYFIGHSLGGLVGRHYVKTFDPKKIKLLVTIGSPHLCGLSRIPRFVAFNILNRRAQLTEQELSMHPSSSTAKLTRTFTEADLYVLSMVNICGTKFRGGDTGFKLKDNLVPDMINLGVNYIHTSLHRNEDTYKIIRNLIFGNSIIYKIRLLYITPTKESPKRARFCLYLKPKDKKDYQRYPNKDFIQVGGKTGKNEPFIPQIPMIIFTYLRDEENIKTDRLEIQIRDGKKKILVEDEIIIALGDKKKVSDHFSLDTGKGYLFQFAVYSYRLNYGFIE
ncbi:MAG: alpha/beta fold hydrolase [Candidatus Heimdallarchaeota archaeon]|nr:MAG: alpha/beta fold hydrolase [Candidatus Heimdallarchaeota archaeon]